MGVIPDPFGTTLLFMYEKSSEVQFLIYYSRYEKSEVQFLKYYSRFEKFKV